MAMTRRRSTSSRPQVEVDLYIFIEVDLRSCFVSVYHRLRPPPPFRFGGRKHLNLTDARDVAIDLRLVVIAVRLSKLKVSGEEEGELEEGEIII